ncbi:hypothetical protein Taro_022611 [Colocasia esculenta]|uniref:Uncharacterized protein n=1 Tax=Colocasia esculenta TaxID=4460 RepID=A0A843V8F5_COLES|nr:hypothetical protein [Colocasia esculenta]
MASTHKGNVNTYLPEGWFSSGGSARIRQWPRGGDEDIVDVGMHQFVPTILEGGNFGICVWRDQPWRHCI